MFDNKQCIPLCISKFEALTATAFFDGPDSNNKDFVPPVSPVGTLFLIIPRNSVAALRTP